jgi:hypothetical protein
MVVDWTFEVLSNNFDTERQKTRIGKIKRKSLGDTGT